MCCDPERKSNEIEHIRTNKRKRLECAVDIRPWKSNIALSDDDMRYLKRVKIDNVHMSVADSQIQELKCSICHGLAMNSYKLVDCKHFFCRDCLSQWTQQEKSYHEDSKHCACPLCRSSINNEPIEYTEQNALIKDLAPHLINMDAYQDLATEYYEKERNQIIEDEDRLLYLVKKAVSSMKSGRTFLNIGHVWKKHERELIVLGLMKFPGTSRRAYLALIGLTTEFVDYASDADIAVACKNLDIKDNSRISLQKFMNCSGYFNIKK